MPNRFPAYVLCGFVAASALAVAVPAQSATRLDGKNVAFKIKPEAKDVAFKATEGATNKKPDAARADQRDDKGKK